MEVRSILGREKVWKRVTERDKDSAQLLHQPSDQKTMVEIINN
jgi:hypothetical protein